MGLTALFTGGALALQIYADGNRFGAEEVVPQIVAIGMVRELGPVLVGLMVAARVTSSIAAEIATMRVTERIDALITLSTDPMKYLVLPRILAGLVTVPLLVGLGDVIGVMGAWLLAVERLGFVSGSYHRNTVDFLEPLDIVSSLVKGAAFGLLATLMGCWFGLASGRGAMGVGRATKSSVVAASTAILAANRVLDGIDLHVPRGESLVVIGGSGSGKSVLLKCILGLIAPDTGTVRLDGQDGMLRPEAKARAIDTLARVGLPARTADLHPAELSGGMQKRAGLARAVSRLIREAVTDLGATANTVTHDMTTVRTLPDRVALLHGGRFRWTGPAADLDQSDDPFVEQFIRGCADGSVATLC